MRAWPGRPHPLGAIWDGSGTHFALFSQHATGVQICLYDRPDAAEPRARVSVRERTDHVWHVYLPDVRPGDLYGYRVSGPYAPEQGHRFNPAKLLVDPYARALTGPVRWSDALYGYPVDGPRQDLEPSPWNSDAFVPKCVVTDDTFPWGDDRPLRTPWNRTVIYECHVKGMTARHPELPEPERGTYRGLASEPVIDHLLALGVTAVELLPVHHAVSEHALLRRGLTNYWGYNTLGFFAPDSRFATDTRGGQVTEFKSMVKALHAAGIEVILDVVYNHTAEGDHLGPTLSLRGIDNASYYLLDPEAPRRYLDFTGCGNTFDTSHPRALQLVMDSLRYWVSEMHVDGFRFDLAPALARQLEEKAGLGRLFDTIQQDPLLAPVKLIAEPWDLGPDGYHVGSFPAGWAEWNGEYRDTVRRFWRGERRQVGALASRLSGSADLYAANARSPTASINFVTCHDGFTLRDLVSYEHKHNEANGEGNRDGTDANWSQNGGVEGPTASVRVNRIRDRLARSLLATLAFSQGVPMISHGDELGRTQRGNNNAYCHDGPLTWVDWEFGAREREMLAFACRAFAIRRENPVLRRRSFFSGAPGPGSRTKDVTWLRADGHEMTTADWEDGPRQALGMLVPGEANDEVDERGRPIQGETLLLLLNAGTHPVYFRLPVSERPGRWVCTLSSARGAPGELRAGALNVRSHSAVLLTLRQEPGSASGAGSPRPPGRWDR